MRVAARIVTITLAVISGIVLGEVAVQFLPAKGLMAVVIIASFGMGTSFGWIAKGAGAK